MSPDQIFDKHLKAFGGRSPWRDSPALYARGPIQDSTRVCAVRVEILRQGPESVRHDRPHAGATASGPTTAAMVDGRGRTVSVPRMTLTSGIWTAPGSRRLLRFQRESAGVQPVARGPSLLGDQEVRVVRRARAGSRRNLYFDDSGCWYGRCAGPRPRRVCATQILWTIEVAGVRIPFAGREPDVHADDDRVERRAANVPIDAASSAGEANAAPGGRRRSPGLGLSVFGQDDD